MRWASFLSMNEIFKNVRKRFHFLILLLSKTVNDRTICSSFEWKKLKTFFFYWTNNFFETFLRKLLFFTEQSLLLNVKFQQKKANERFINRSCAAKFKKIDFLTNKHFFRKTFEQLNFLNKHEQTMFSKN